MLSLHACMKLHFPFCLVLYFNLCLDSKLEPLGCIGIDLALRARFSKRVRKEQQLSLLQFDVNPNKLIYCSFLALINDANFEYIRTRLKNIVKTLA